MPKLIYLFLFSTLIFMFISKKFLFNKKSTKKFIYMAVTTNAKDIDVKWFLKQLKKHNLTYNIEQKYLLNNKNNKKFYWYQSYLLNKYLGDNKIICSRLLKINNIPIPNYVSFDLEKENYKDLKFKIKFYKLKYPLVVKPIDGQRGFGITVYINNYSTLVYYIKKIINSNIVFDNPNRKINKNVFIIEEFKYGTNYRIYMINDKIVSVYDKNKPTLVGNGKHTLQKLLNSYNKNKQNNKISFNSIDLKLVKRQIDINKIIPKGKIVLLTNHYDYINYNVFNVKKIHKDNILLFKKIQKVSGFQLNGIDLIIKDITKSWKDNNGFINEINSYPGIAFFKLNKYSDEISNMYFKTLINEKSLWK